MLSRLAFFALLAGGMLGYVAYLEVSLTRHASDVPEEISLKDLIARGADGNPRLTLTDYVLCANMVREFKENDSSRWTHVWVPIVCAEDKAPMIDGVPAPTNIKAIISSGHVPSFGHLKPRLDQPKLTGMVANRITSIDRRTRDLLQNAYPHTDFDTCIIFQDGREPLPKGLVIMFGIGSAALLMIATGLYILSRETST